MVARFTGEMVILWAWCTSFRPETEELFFPVTKLELDDFLEFVRKVTTKSASMAKFVSTQFKSSLPWFCSMPNEFVTSMTKFDVLCG